MLVKILSLPRSTVACSWRRPPDRLILTEGGDFKRDTFATSHRKIARQLPLSRALERALFFDPKLDVAKILAK